MYTTEIKPQRALLIGVDTGEYDAELSLRELAELAETAGAQVVGEVLQKAEKQNNATYIGSGKLQEVKSLCESHQVDLLLFDDELTGVQLRNIEAETGADAVDRTMLILDIFAQRARSNEGKLQVELAQQRYLLPRLIGMGKKLSRQQGGIGSRGPGESKLESDRRHIRRRIDTLEAELKELTARRKRIRERRGKNQYASVAIVGYTNVGKSTLLNALTDAGVLAKDQLFATLDPTARELRLPDGQKAMLVDTVGLLRRLPHQLIQAFRSTLEEAAEADLLLVLCDASDDSVKDQLAVTESLLGELGCGDIPRITVYNKADLLPGWPEEASGAPDGLPRDGRTVFLSAKTGQGIPGLIESMARCLSEQVCRMKLRLPYSEGGLADRVRKQGRVLAETYENDGILLTAVVDRRLTGLLAPYVVRE